MSKNKRTDEQVAREDGQDPSAFAGPRNEYRCVVCRKTKEREEMKVTVDGEDQRGTCLDCWDDDDSEPSAYANAISRFARLEGQARSARQAARTVAEMAASATKQAADAEAEVKRLSE